MESRWIRLYLETTAFALVCLIAYILVMNYAPFAFVMADSVQSIGAAITLFQALLSLAGVPTVCLAVGLKSTKLTLLVLLTMVVNITLTLLVLWPNTLD